MKPIEIYQDEDKSIIVDMNEDISAATEIEFSIETPTRITKTLTAAQISNVTATQFTVQIDAADFASTRTGEYKYQARATLASRKYNIKFTPNKVKIMDSVFVDVGNSLAGDY